MYDLTRIIKRILNSGCDRAGTAVAAALIVLVALAAPAGALADPGPPESAMAGDVADELDAIGLTLKAAVMSGALSEEDAIKIYFTLAAELSPDWAKKDDEKKDYAKKNAAAEAADDPYAAKLDFMMLSAPEPGEVVALFQPEFLDRDLQLLRRELELDQGQMEIIEILLRNYLEAFELASMPLRNGFGRYWRTRSDQWMAEALERVRIDDVDVAVANTRDVLERLRREDGVEDPSPERAAENAAKRAARDEWERRVVDITATMGDRLANIRQRVHTRLAEAEQAGSKVIGDDLVRHARQLRADRVLLRAGFTESLELIALIEQTEAERARFDAAITRVRINHELNHGRLGGETTDLWAALAETSRTDGSHGPVAADDLVEAMFQMRGPGIAASLEARMQSTLDRELGGLEFQVTRDRLVAAADRDSGGKIEADRLTKALRPFASDCRRELAASVVVRDELLALLDETGALMEAADADSDIPMLYRDAALRSGFRTEMRLRWSERALKAALQLEDLHVAAHTVLIALQGETAGALRRLRQDAIAERIQRDPKLARDRIDALLETGDAKRDDFSLEDLLGSNHQAYMTLDQRTEDQLRAILTPEQVATLPPRQSWSTGEKRKVGGKKASRGKGK